MEVTLELRSLIKSFQGHLVVEDVSFSVRPGVVTGLLGPNGAGKTTTMRMILGIIPPDSGTIKILGSDSAFAVRRRVGYLPEERGLYMKMRASEMLTYIGELKGLTRAKARSAAYSWLERLDLGERADSPIERLSKGLAQRVQLAAALVHDPELVIFDEPMSGLDPIAADIIKDVIVDLAHRQGKTVLLSTHDMAGAERLCEELVLIDRGRVVLSGEMSDIKSRYGKSAIAIFFEGDPTFLRTVPGVAGVSIYGNYADIEVQDGADAHSILADCIGNLRIYRFELVEPSLTEIFRRSVTRAHADELTQGRISR